MDGVSSASADVVTTRAVLAYIADKVGAIRQFYRVLKPGGRISIGEPIYRDEAIHLATLTNSLRSQPTDLRTANIRLWQRCRAAQLPSTIEEIQSNALTNFSERDLLGFFQTVGFTNIHLELHIDISTQSPIPWETFIDRLLARGRQHRVKYWRRISALRNSSSMSNASARWSSQGSSPGETP